MPNPPPPLLFLPGAAGRGSFWDPVRFHISSIYSDAVDWPGLGGVPSRPDIHSYGDLAAMVIDRLSEPTVLVGQSMGGYVAALIAVERPELVSSLVLCVTSAGIDLAGHDAHDWRVGARKNRPSDPDWSYEWHPPIEDQLAALDIPTLLLWASHDRISPITIGHRLAELIEKSELVIYDSDDHRVVQHNAADVAARIMTLVDGY